MTRCGLVALAFPLAAYAADPDRGRDIALAPGDAGCPNCHEIPGAARPSREAGPSLAGVGSRLSAYEIFWRIVDASRFNEDSAMPPYGRVAGAHEPRLSTTEIEDVAAFLATLK